VALHFNAIAIRVVLGIGLSIGSALITKSFAPILSLGLLLGAGTGLAYELLH
jgi:hypothetical protein